MKVLYLANSIIPSRTANSVHVMKMCQAFSKNTRVSEVELIVPFSNNHVDDIYSYYGVDESFKVVRRKKGAGRLSWYNFSSRQVSYVINNIKRKEKESTLIYGRNILSCLFLLFFNYKVIYECHSPINRYNFIIRMLFKALSKRFVKVIVISNKLKEIISKDNPLLSEKIAVLHDSSDPTPDQYLKINKRNENLNAGYIGHLYEGRGVDLLIRLAADMPSVTFHFFGGESKDIDRLKLEVNSNNVLFHGYLNPSQIPKVRSNMDVLLAPYQKNTSIQGLVNTSEYMSPLKIFEYMSSRRPLISSNLPVLREVLTNRVNCLLVEPDNISAWYEALSLILNDVDLGEKIANEAYDNFVSEYSWDVRASRVMGILDENR